MTQVFIATPIMWGTVKSAYMQTVIGTLLDLQRHRIEVRLELHDNSDIVTARNVLLSRFLEDPACTHLFFVDSDMQFDPALCRRMIRHDKPVIGAAYAQKWLDLDTLKQHLSKGIPLEDALALAQDYTVIFQSTELLIADGICQVDGIGFGAALIRRDVVEQMAETGAARFLGTDNRHRSYGLRNGMYDFCGALNTSTGGRIGEDWSFCARWKERCGGEVWAVVDADVKHVGDMAYGQPYIRKLQRGRM